MNDLISRQAAIDEVARWEGFLDEDMIYCIQRGLKSVPPAQPEIIRCKDCKHRPIEKNGFVLPPEDDEKCPCLCEDPFYSWIPRDDFFCANGERREE